MRHRKQLSRLSNGRYRFTFPDKGTITVYANSENKAVTQINKILKPKHILIQKKKSVYWQFPKGKPAPNNYLWDGKGWRKRE